VIDPACAVSMGLTTASYAWLLRLAGFHRHAARILTEGAFGPPQPARWRWRPARRQARAARTGRRPPPGSAFAALAGLVR
jgi:ATP-dependent RNA helicase SUPV3L1/SUV3